MEIAILGPLAVRDGGKPVVVGPRKQRLLLALLVLNANRVVTTDRILEDLWGDDTEGREKTLWVYISRLRSALGDGDVIVTRDYGYCLVVDPDDLDVHRFEAAAAAGGALIKQDPAAASQLLSDGLALWRGPALEEFAYEEFAQPEIARLEELRLVALGDRIDADLRRGLARELVSELEALQLKHPTRERVVSQLMLALYRAGRQSDALRGFERFRAHVGQQSGLEPSPELRRLEEQILLHDSRVQARPVAGDRSGVAPASADAVNPFKGLRAFYEEDAADFYGRDRLVSDVIRRLDAGASLIGLVGPSGSGKSSIVRAGVIPALRKGAIAGSDRWVIAQMVPGSHPFAELEAALLRSSLDAPDSLSTQLADTDAGVLRAALRVLPEENARVLLMVDQFEELFTLVDDDRRARFLTGLLNATDDPHGRVKVIFTLRADFYARPLAHPDFGSRMAEGIVNVVPMSSDELEAAARRPAEEIGAALEPALLAALLTDVVGRPGGLPLFQYALTELFDRRADDALTLASYRSMDGVRGALSRRADDLYRGLDTDQQTAAQQLFLRLVTIADGDEWGRRRVPASEILALGLDVIDLQSVIDAFAKHRLLTLDRDIVTGSPTIEVAHEALLTEWDRLRGWIQDAREDLKRHVSLTAAIDEWNEADRNPDYLLSGARLEAYEQWAAASSIHLTHTEQEFISAGGDRRNNAHDERQAQEAAAKRSSRRRRWAVLAVALVLTGGSGAVFVATRPTDPVRVAAFGPASMNENLTSQAQTGFASAERELGVEVEYLGGRVVSNLEAEYRALGDRGTDLILLNNTDGRYPWLEDVVADYPDTAFVFIDPFYGSVSGATSAEFAHEQAGFLAGAAAALATDAGVVGFVGGVQWEIIEKWRAGFEAGALVVNPDVEILAVYVASDFSNGFESPDRVRALALDLFRQGADVVLAATATASSGAIEAAKLHTEETGVQAWAIAPASDWSASIGDDLQPYLLTSAITRVDVAVVELIRQYIDDKLDDGEQTLTVSSGAVSLAPSPHLTATQLETIEKLTADVAAGVIEVPHVPVGQVQPPDDARLGGEITVTWDGRECSYSGSEDSFAVGAATRVDFVNLTPDAVTLRAHFNRGTVLELPGRPSGTTSGYIHVHGGVYELTCVPQSTSLEDGIRAAYILSGVAVG